METMEEQIVYNYNIQVQIPVYHIQAMGQTSGKLSPFSRSLFPHL